MVDWKSEAEIAQDGVAFSRFMHTLLGLYIWEFFTSLPFDWDFISGKKKFRWPLIFYFAGRYFLLFALIGIAIALNVTKPVNCQALYTYNQVRVWLFFFFSSSFWWSVAPRGCWSSSGYPLVLRGIETSLVEIRNKVLPPLGKCYYALSVGPVT